MTEKYECPDCRREMTKEEFERFNSIDPCECPCWMIEEIMDFKRMRKNKIHKIGRNYYKEIPQDKNGEPKILRGIEDEEIFTLVDCDGEPIKFFKRIKKFKLKQGKNTGVSRTKVRFDTWKK